VGRPARRESSRISGGTLAGTIVAQIVFVHAVHDVGVAALAADPFENREQFVFAVKAAVRIVLHVVGVFELVRFDVFVADSELPGEGFGVSFVRCGYGGGIGGDRDNIVAQSLPGGPREISGIGPSGVGDDYAAHLAQYFDEPVFPGLQAGRIGGRGGPRIH
jgi:hypothetical protein